ncbi:MAG: NTP transferase domain-containing protein [Lewinellaceae bacterium]|nr:NTP transferase domain-containing protein [Lewinellaceae bacterium]
MLYGLVLAGGESRRMGTPKSLISYHGMPQYRHAATLLGAYCSKIFVSCQPGWEERFGDLEPIPDREPFRGSGPIGGLLSAISVVADAEAWCLLGCDYPLLEIGDLEMLLEQRDKEGIATVFANEETGKPEPLIGIYEKISFPLLNDWFFQGNQSLRLFLEHHGARLVACSNPHHLLSADTPDKAAEAMLVCQKQV